MTPPPCNCAHNKTVVVWARGNKLPQMKRQHQCIHPSGPHPMHEGCPWMAAKTRGAMA